MEGQMAALTAIVGLVGVVLGGFYWVSGKLDRLADLLRTLTADMRDRVTFEACSAKRHSCPVMVRLEALEKELKEDRR